MTNKQTLTLFYFTFQNLEILGCDKLPPLKEISSPRFEEAGKKIGFSYVEVGYHP
jgi:hypothetical protein